MYVHRMSLPVSTCCDVGIVGKCRVCHNRDTNDVVMIFLISVICSVPSHFIGIKLLFKY